MLSGTISGNSSRADAGIVVSSDNRNVLNLFGGTISGNTALETLSNGVRFNSGVNRESQVYISAAFNLQDGLFHPNVAHDEGFIRFADGEERLISLPGRGMVYLYFSQSINILTAQINYSEGILTVNWMGTYHDFTYGQIVEFHPNGNVVVVQ